MYETSSCKTWKTCKNDVFNNFNHVEKWKSTEKNTKTGRFFVSRVENFFLQRWECLRKKILGRIKPFLLGDFDELLMLCLLSFFIVMPLALVNDLLGYWSLPQLLCGIWVSFDIMGSTASVRNTISLFALIVQKLSTEREGRGEESRGLHLPRYTIISTQTRQAIENLKKKRGEEDYSV